MINTTIDTKEFEKVFDKLKQVNKREISVISNNVLKDICYLSGDKIISANANEIRALKAKPWWKKLIVKLLKRKNIKPTRKAIAAKSRAVIRNRLFRIGYLRAGFILAGNKFGGSKKFKNFGSIDVIVSPATVDNKTSEVTIIWPTKDSPEILEKKALEAVQIGINKKVADIEQYITRKINEVN